MSGIYKIFALFSLISFATLSSCISRDDDGSFKYPINFGLDPMMQNASIFGFGDKISRAIELSGFENKDVEKLTPCKLMHLIPGDIAVCKSRLDTLNIARNERNLKSDKSGTNSSASV